MNFFLVGGGGGGAKMHYGQLEIQIFITVYFVTPSFELVHRNAKKGLV